MNTMGVNGSMWGDLSGLLGSSRFGIFLKSGALTNF